MNQQIAKGKWTEFKGEIRKMWGDLTDNELEQTKGNVQAIGGLLQQKYGQMKDNTKVGFDGLIKKFGHDGNAQVEQAKEDLRSNVRDNH